MLFADMLKKITPYVLMLCALMAYLPIKYGDIPMYVATVLFLHALYKRQITFPDDVKGYFLAFGVWAGAMLVCSFTSCDAVSSFKAWLNWFVWRPLPCLLMLCAALTIKWNKAVLSSLTLMFMVIAVAIIYKGFVTGQRAGGIFTTSPMIEAGYMMLFIPLSLITFYDERIFGKYRLVAGVLSGVASVAMLFNQTRGTWIAVGVTAIVIVWRYWHWNKINKVFTLILLVIPLLVVVMKPSLLNRWTSDINHFNNIARVRIWTAAYNMWRDYPMFGIGFRQFAPNYQKKYILSTATNSEKVLEHAHNSYMHMMAEGGTIGLFAFLLCFGYFLRQSWKDYKKYEDPYSFAIFCITMSLMLRGLTEYDFAHTHVMKCYWMLMGGLLALHVQAKQLKE